MSDSHSRPVVNSPADGAEARDRDMRLHGQRTQTPRAEDKTGASSESAAGAVIATGTDLQELVKRLRARGHVGGPTEPISVLLALAADMIERLGGKLRRINAINDSPATFNREIDRLTSCSNFIAPDEYCEKVIGHEGACGYEPAPTVVIATGTERFNVPGVLRMLEAEAAAAFAGERTKIELVARLIRQQQEEIERLTSVADAEMKLREGNFAQIERLQRALAFWLPGVPADDPEVAQRAGDDAGLLAGYQGDEPDAEDLGWISLREAP